MLCNERPWFKQSENNGLNVQFCEKDNQDTSVSIVYNGNLCYFESRKHFFEPYFIEYDYSKSKIEIYKPKKFIERFEKEYSDLMNKDKSNKDQEERQRLEDEIKGAKENFDIWTKDKINQTRSKQD